MQDLEFQFSDFTDQADINSNYDSFVTKYTEVVKLRKTSIKDYFLKVTTGGNNIMSNKTFWKTIKPFLGSRKSPNHNSIVLEENGTSHENKQEVIEILNDCFVNIVEVTTGKPPSSQNFNGVSEILDKHKNHPSIIKIKSSQTQHEELTIPLTPENDIFDILTF